MLPFLHYHILFFHSIFKKKKNYVLDSINISIQSSSQYNTQCYSVLSERESCILTLQRAFPCLAQA